MNKQTRRSPNKDSFFFYAIFTSYIMKRQLTQNVNIINNISTGRAFAGMAKTASFNFYIFFFEKEYKK